MWIQSTLQNEKGFTLIELIFALLIMAIGILGISSVAATVAKGNGKAKQTSTAVFLAQEKLEEVALAGYTDANGEAGTENYGSITDFPKYRRVTTVQNDTPVTGTKTITVTVNWRSGEGTFEANTILGSPPST